MAAEPERHPPEPPPTSAPATVTATDTVADIPAATQAPPPTTQPCAENTGSPVASKRQRRPSVRLGEIGDQPSTRVHESHTRRPTIPPWSWSIPKGSKTAKARSSTNLANGSADSHDIQEFEERNNNNNNSNNNLYGNGSTEFLNRKAKAKRGSTTKRVRSNWVPIPDDGAQDDNRPDGDEAFRDFDPHSDTPPLKDQSPVHSVHNVALDFWQIGQHRHRVLENGAVESDSMDRKCGTSEGVKSWLIELGLSRYAPMFEIHEVDDELLPMLTLEDLKDMGINAVGSRRKMYTAIQKLRQGFP